VGAGAGGWLMTGFSPWVGMTIFYTGKSIW